MRGAPVVAALLLDCPGGWVRLFTQEAVLTDGAPARLGIAAEHSMMRDCLFALHGIDVLGELELNDPDCATVPAAATDWGSLRGRYR